MRVEFRSTKLIHAMNFHKVPKTTQPSVSFVESRSLDELIERAVVISFDFFDTLFVRPLVNPEDAFDILGEQFSMPDFRDRRRAAQSEAFRRMHATGRKEITLADIYDCFTKTDASNSELMDAEYALELALIEPNPEIFELFSTLIAAGKRVVITSDMYFSTDFFVEALSPYGLAHVQLFISADCNATKRDTGELFDIVTTRLGLTAEDILHIGDNQLADVTRPREKGLMAFHYQADHRRVIKKALSLTTSIGHGLLGTSAKDIPPDSYNELGFIYGGPANLGFFEWIRERARLDNIDHVLFLSRDGYSLERIAKKEENTGFPDHCYFLGSRTAYTLAAINTENFSTFLPFLLSGSDGLAPSELLERIGVPPPSLKIMADLKLGAEVRVNAALHKRLTDFLYAYRGEILKVCQRNRRALYQYLKQMGIKEGSRVALVDVGWNGTTQEAFESAVHPLMNLKIFGYYFCLADTPDRLRREATQKMSAMISTATTSAATVTNIYNNRVAVEQFFSAPHSSVIGLRMNLTGIEPVMDVGRGNTDELQQIAEDVCNGIDAFVVHYGALQRRLNLRTSPLQIAWPLIEMLLEPQGNAHHLLGKIKNFDAWGSSRNHELSLANYLT